MRFGPYGYVVKDASNKLTLQAGDIFISCSLQSLLGHSSDYQHIFYFVCISLFLRGLSRAYLQKLLPTRRYIHFHHQGIDLWR